MDHRRKHMLRRMRGARFFGIAVGLVTAASILLGLDRWVPVVDPSDRFAFFAALALLVVLVAAVGLPAAAAGTGAAAWARNQMHVRRDQEWMWDHDTICAALRANLIANVDSAWGSGGQRYWGGAGGRYTKGYCTCKPKRGVPGVWIEEPPYSPRGSTGVDTLTP